MNGFLDIMAIPSFPTDFSSISSAPTTSVESLAWSITTVSLDNIFGSDGPAGIASSASDYAGSSSVQVQVPVQSTFQSQWETARLSQANASTASTEAPISSITPGPYGAGATTGYESSSASASSSTDSLHYTRKTKTKTKSKKPKKNHHKVTSDDAALVPNSLAHPTDVSDENVVAGVETTKEHHNRRKPKESRSEAWASTSKRAQSASSIPSETWASETASKAVPSSSTSIFISPEASGV